MLKKTAEFSVVFRDKKRDISFIERHKIGTQSFTRERKLGFDKMMTMIIKKSNKSIQNSLLVPTLHVVTHTRTLSPIQTQAQNI